MTREEAIKYLINPVATSTKIGEEKLKEFEAYNMAIEALQEPKTIIGIDIPYGSDKGIATLFKGKDDKLILEEVKEIMSVVRCKDCKHRVYTEDGESNPHDIVCDYHMSDGFDETDFCSYGERREP